MCWNESVSWITFTLGTIINIFAIFYIKNPIFTCVSMMWQWVLLMQLFEALAWHNQDCNSTTNKIGTYGAFFANITQPLIVFISLFIATVTQTFKSDYQTNYTKIFQILASIIIVSYVVYMIATLYDKRYDCLTTTDTCDQLHYSWWDDTSAIPYIIALISIILLLLRPLSFCIYQVLFILGTLLITNLFYNDHNGSIWCFFAASAPIFNILFWKLLVT